MKGAGDSDPQDYQEQQLARPTLSQRQHLMAMPDDGQAPRREYRRPKEPPPGRDAEELLRMAFPAHFRTFLQIAPHHHQQQEQ
jgi:hypothetical protein